MPLRRASDQPLFAPADIPPLRPDLVEVSSVFNPGATVWHGRELLLLRVQTRGRTTLILPAERRAGGKVEVTGPPVDFEGLGDIHPLHTHVYDPRLTVIDDVLYVTLAVDSPDGCRLLTARSEDFDRWRIIGLDDGGDLRNGVLFPQRFDGRYLRLQRPNRSAREGAPSTGSAITLARSSDLVAWTEIATVMEGRPQRWDEWIGSGPPPVKTRQGWLHLYHGVATHFASSNIYQAGVVLLDLANPSRVLHRGAFNVLEPREAWELTGQVPNVVFPSGMVVETVDAEGFAEPDSPVRVYYGAAETVIGLSVTTIAELLADARFTG